MKALNNTTITVFGDSISKGLFLNGTKIDKLGTSAVDILQNNFMERKTGLEPATFALARRRSTR